MPELARAPLPGGARLPTRPRELRLAIGQHSDKGRKPANQDFHGALIPEQPALGLKGVAIALADGISSSDVSQVASESAVKGFLTDYYCTSDSWSVKTSAQRVIAATNSWLHAQTRRRQHGYELGEERDRGYVCTLSVVIVKSNTAHIFHVGDSRVYRLSGGTLEQLTEDHRVKLSSAQVYLARALGMQAEIEIDYRTVPLAQGDVLVLATDGIYEHVDARFVAATITQASDLDAAARTIVAEAHARGSPDNLTIQIVRVDELPDGEAREVLDQAGELKLPPLLEPRMLFDGYRIVRQLHASSRSHIYLAVDGESDTLVALKIPSLDLRSDAQYLKRFMMEEWVARRISSAHVLKPWERAQGRGYLYVATEFVEGQTLTQWMRDHPWPGLDAVRDIVEQIARGLQAFHRKEMLHQDLRPENIMIDRTGTAKIIDFGSTRVAGVIEAAPPSRHDNDILGTAQYTAPEYFLGENGSPRADIFSLGVITYQMLTGRLPYGTDVAKARTRSAQKKLAYAPAHDGNSAIPAWVDGALQRAVHPDPLQRYDELSEFLYDLRHPNPALSNAAPATLIERNPLLFWQGLCFLLLCAVLALLYWR